MVTRQASYGPIKRLIQWVTGFVVEKNSAIEVTFIQEANNLQSSSSCVDEVVQRSVFCRRQHLPVACGIARE